MSEVHLFVAIRRKKENPQLKERSIRHIIRNEARDFEIIKSIISQQDDGGIWRIYKTINARDTSKAMKDLRHKIIEDELIHEKLETTWKTCLLQEKCKATNYLLIDIDTKDQETFAQIYDKLLPGTIKTLTNTPNGIHIVVDRQDVREIELIDDVEIKRDALLFIEIYEKGVGKYEIN